MGSPMKLVLVRTGALESLVTNLEAGCGFDVAAVWTESGDEVARDVIVKAPLVSSQL
jgi:hypothetical protein